MFENGSEEGTDASAILSAVKAEVLAGIYQQDQKKPALRAQKVGKGWWQLFDAQSSDRLVFCWKEPASAPPMLVMRKGVKSSKESLDPALREAWKECGLPSEPSKPYEVTLPSKAGGEPTGGGPADRPACDEDVLTANLAECKKHFLDCDKNAEDWRATKELRCKDEHCLSDATWGHKKLEQRCFEMWNRCQKGALLAAKTC
jgi:hypothetical protein